MVLSGFCHFGLVLFTYVLSCFHVSVRLRVCSSRALSRLRALFRVGAWCSDPGTHVLSLSLMLHSCYVLCCVARSSCFSLAACFHVVMSCVNTRLMSVHISCVFVSCFAHGW